MTKLNVRLVSVASLCLSFASYAGCGGTEDGPGDAAIANDGGIDVQRPNDGGLGHECGSYTGDQPVCARQVELCRCGLGYEVTTDPCWSPICEAVEKRHGAAYKQAFLTCDPCGDFGDWEHFSVCLYDQLLVNATPVQHDVVDEYCRVCGAFLSFDSGTCAENVLALYSPFLEETDELVQRVGTTCVPAGPVDASSCNPRFFEACAGAVGADAGPVQVPAGCEGR